MNKEGINYNFKITIRAICMYEKLTGKPFSEFFDSPDNILPMVYCVLFSHPENKFRNTYQEALPLLSNDKVLEPIALGISKEFNIIKQFNEHQDNQTTDSSVDDSKQQDNKQQESSKVFMTDAVPILVSDCGLSIGYVMDEMDYTDIDAFIKYREQKHQNYLEEQRLFTFLTVLPHIDHKKMKTAEDLLPFPWEKKKKVDKFNREQKDMVKKLKELGIIKEAKKEV